ncbi:MAG: hypothetical protein II888_00005, partial [Clostridia bacterium]|nr:hypothetical protein [Clostridia bacterium]
RKRSYPLCFPPIPVNDGFSFPVFYNKSQFADQGCRSAGNTMDARYCFELCHIADILLQIKYKKSEPFADRLQVRISRVWWSIADSNR